MRTSSLIILLCLTATLLPAQDLPDFSVLQEDARTLVIEYRPLVLREPLGLLNGTPAFRYRLAGGETDRQDSIVNLAPRRTLLLLLPSRSYTLQVLQAEYRDTLDPSIATRGVLVRLPDFGSSLRAVEDPTPRQPEAQGRLVMMEELVDRGASKLAVLRIRPVVPLPQNRIRVYQRIVLRIDHDPLSPGSPPVSSYLRGAANQVTLKREAARSAASDSPLSTGTWYRFDVTEDGVYRIDLDYLRRSNISLPSSPGIGAIRIFGNGGRVLPEDLSAPRPPDLLEVPRYVVDVNRNGILDPEDYILIFCRSTRGWDYIPAQRTYRHHIHPYAERNSYFIALGLQGTGREMDTLASGPVSVGGEVPDFQEKVFLEQERYNLIKSGRRWVGQLFDQYTNAVAYTNLLNGLVTASPVLYRYSLLSHSATLDTFYVSENNIPLGNPVLLYPVDVSPSNNESAYASEALIDGVTRTGELPGDRSILKFRFVSQNQSAQAWLDWFEILYRRRFEAINDYLQFTSPDTTGLITFKVQNLSSRNVLVFDVTRHDAVKRITQVAFDPADPTLCRFSVLRTADSVGEYVVAGPASYKSPASAVAVRNSNLRGQQAPVDFVIISPTEFLPEAQRLKAHRESHDVLRTLVVDISAIYNEFSGGLQDVMAVRDFLRYTQTTWMTHPRYALLFGNGHYDYKNTTSSAPNWIPPYESVESIYQIHSYTSDDHFVFLNPSDYRTSMPIGRIPARSRQDAAAMVDKIISYETASPFDPWRKRVTFVADDDITSTGMEANLHTPQAESLANLFTPDAYEKKKIYLIEYPTVNSAVGRRKPDVNKAIVDELNQGTLIINYIGHGNERLWAHEAVFTREGDLPRLTNRDRLTFLVGATCNFAQFDDPTEQSTGEAVLTMAAGGAIAEVAASRAGYSDENAAMNEALYSNLFQRDSTGLPPRLGDVMWRTKQDRNGPNDLKYLLLGDPTLRLVMPRTTATIDTINGAPSTTMTYVQSLGKATITGAVHAPNGTPLTSFDGRAVVQLFDAKRIVTIPRWAPFTFSETGSLLYQGEVSVKNGSFRAVFPIPKDVSYGASSRISLYAWNDASDASGYTESIQISGIDSTGVPDSTGPAIEIYLNDLNFRSGDVVPSTSTMIVRLADQSGINTSTVGIGHRLEARLTNPERTIELSNFYRSDLDTYQSGEIRYLLSDVPEGQHVVRVKAWDIQNNSSEAEAAFDVRSSDILDVINPVNYPNPFSGQTTFTFQRASTNPIDVEVRIYSVAGRLLQTVHAEGLSDRFVRILWDGRDRDGDLVANGVYLYRIVARTTDGGQSAEAMGKLTVIR